MTTRVLVAPTEVTSSLIGAKTTNSLDASSTGSLPFLRLPHPRTGIPSLFLANDNAPSTSKQDASQHQLLEVQAISPDVNRSWFLSDDTVVQDGKLLVLTPIDPIFLLVPLLEPVSSTAQFRPLDDIFEEATEKVNATLSELSVPDCPPISAEDVSSFARLSSVRSAVERICEKKDLTEDLSVHRFSKAKFLEVVKVKTDRIADPSAFDSFSSLTRSLAKDGLFTEKCALNSALQKAGRQRVACDILSQYLSPSLSEELIQLYNFDELNQHLEAMKQEDAALAAAQAVKANEETSGKQKQKSTATKKGKAKNQPSRGVTQLTKANVEGMAKLSSFFTKKAK
ncbi:hypothetical protein FRC03_012877 [Tulasnella sp. 419]|nr:hypothetical protein FRC02_000393 [Tulasnella sp. 418]KAG8965849.1 hypothetical protein FRC03_012877 [Tulasnella sp. 419]